MFSAQCSGMLIEIITQHFNKVRMLSTSRIQFLFCFSKIFTSLLPVSSPYKDSVGQARATNHFQPSREDPADEHHFLPTRDGAGLPNVGQPC